MKKSILTLSLTALMAFGIAGSLASCGNGSGTEDKKTTINIQFVPSRDAGQLATLASNLAPILEKYEPDYKFNITTGTTYAATTEAMLSNQIDVGFLTASGYAEATLKHEGAVEVLLTSVRKGYQVQVDFQGEEKQMAAMNGEVEGYTYLGEQSTTDVNWYSSQLVVRADKCVDKNGDGKITVEDIAGLKIARQGTTSGAGYLRPLKYLNDHGMEMVDVLDSSKTNQIKGVVASSYDNALEMTMAGDVDGFWGFTDVRYSNGYNKKDSQYYHDASIFTTTKVVAITDGIYNDTISVRANLDEKVKAAVKNAFKKAVADGTKDEANTGAYYLYNLYSHTGYTDAKDSDFNGEREFYQYCVDHNLLK